MSEYISIPSVAFHYSAILYNILSIQQRKNSCTKRRLQMVRALCDNILILDGSVLEEHKSLDRKHDLNFVRIHRVHTRIVLVMSPERLAPSDWHQLQYISAYRSLE